MAGFYHMDWPYALNSQHPRQKEQQLLLAAAPAAAEAGASGVPATASVVCPSISAADRKAAGCLYSSIWRRLRAGKMRTAEALAAAKGASWLVEVLRGTLHAAAAAVAAAAAAAAKLLLLLLLECIERGHSTPAVPVLLLSFLMLLPFVHFCCCCDVTCCCRCCC